jgi:hypothetical protein
MALGDANTRDRDYGDVYLVSGIYTLEGESLRGALLATAEHRGREIRPLGPLLVTLRESRLVEPAPAERRWAQQLGIAKSVLCVYGPPYGSPFINVFAGE